MRGVGADHPPADDDDLRGQHAGHPAEQDALSAVDTFEGVGGSLDREPAGHFGHRREERQPPGRRSDRFVSDAHRSARDEVRGLSGIGGEVEIGEQDLPGAQQRALRGLGLLDLYDHLRPVEDRPGIRGDGRAHFGVVRVGGAYSGPRPALHDDVVAVQGDLVHAVRRESHAIFVVLDLLRYPDEHPSAPRASSEPGRPAPAKCSL